MAELVVAIKIVGILCFGHVDTRIVAEVEPSIVEVSSLNSSLVNITCIVHKQTPVRKIFLIQILKKHTLKENFSPIAELAPNRPNASAKFLSNANNLGDIHERFRVFGYQTSSFVDSYIRLQTNSSNMLSSDGGHYQCKLVYQSNNSNIVTTVDETILTVKSKENYLNSGTSWQKQGRREVIMMVMAVFCVKRTCLKT